MEICNAEDFRVGIALGEVWRETILGRFKTGCGGVKQTKVCT